MHVYISFYVIIRVIILCLIRFFIYNLNFMIRLDYRCLLVSLCVIFSIFLKNCISVNFTQIISFFSIYGKIELSADKFRLDLGSIVWLLNNHFQLVLYFYLRLIWHDRDRLLHFFNNRKLIYLNI